MYTEIKNAINAAEDFEAQLQWWKKSLIDEIERYQSMEDRDEWDDARLKEASAKLDLYNHVMLCAQKWVKSQL